MKKNEKGFMQEEKNLEKVAGGAMASGVEVDTEVDFKARDITGVGVNTNKTNNHDNHKTQELKFGNISGGISGVNFTNS